MSIIQAAGSGEVGSSGFYKLLLDQSLKFNDADSPYLYRTPASQGSLTTFTFSFWYKRSKLGTYQEVLHVYPGSGERSQILFMNNDTLKVELEAGNTNQFLTNMLFRDTSAWYHVVVTFDSTNGTQANRVKIYVNGVDQSGTGGGGFSTANYPSQNATSGFNTTSQHEISTYDGSDYHLDGYLAEVNFIDGTALTAASFGETKNNIWIPKDTSGLTFGTNGFHLTFKDDVISEGFNTVTYTGTGANNSISGIGFDPALVWIKSRSNTYDNQFYDTVRGPTKRIFSNKTDAELTGSDLVQSFDADGFTIGTNVGLNNSGSTYVGWCWEADTAFSNDASATGVGNIDSSGKTNTAKGFSIIKWTYSTSADNLIAHGLGAAPTWILVKSRTTAYNWDVYHSGLSAASKRLILNSSGAEVAGFFDTTPTSTVFEYNTSAASNNDEMIAYCWTDISGYSKFGSYTGNANATGPSVTLGFAPAWILIKNASASENWYIWDNTREPAPAQKNKRLHPNLDVVEQTSTGRSITFTATGFQVTDTDSSVNGNGNTFIYAAFADTRSAAFFKDVSTNGNNFTPVNLDYRDSVPDTPTNSFATLNPLDNISTTYSEGNLQYAQSDYNYNSRGTMAVTSGKWYWEIRMSSTHGEFGVCENGKAGQSDPQANIGFNFIYNNGSAGISWKNATAGSQATTGISMTNWSAGDICQIAYDADNGILYHGLNGTYQTSGDPAAGSGGLITGIAPQFGGTMVPFFGSGTGNARTWVVNFGQDSSFAGLVATSNSNADGEGHGSFAYAPPSGYLALCSQNLPDADIIDGTDNFNTVTYTGTGSSNSVTGVGFQPDWVWGKRRDSTGNHWLNDAVRGATKGLHSDSTSAEYTDATVMNAFNSDGFTVVSHAISNASSATYVAWNWRAGTAFSNDASATSVGDTDSEGQVNTKAGFAIIKWTSGGSSVVAHGLGKKPDFIIIKSRNGTENWLVGNSATGFANRTKLNTTAAEGSSSAFSGGVTTTTFTENIAASSYDKIAYVFANTEGYCKAGSYVGNGNANGTFVFTGFRPAWIMVKKSSGTEAWWIVDSVRETTNPLEYGLQANDSAAELSPSKPLDFLSNGFKPRVSTGYHNDSGATYVYLAFAEQPFKFSNAR